MNICYGGTMKQKGTDLVTKDFLEEKLSKVKSELRNELRVYHDEIMTKLDEIVGELQTMREENTIGAYQTPEIRNQVEDHERRLKRLEKHSL